MPKVHLAAVECPTCKAYVPLNASDICWRCETLLPDDLEVTDADDDELWHRGPDD